MTPIQQRHISETCGYENRLNVGTYIVFFRLYFSFVHNVCLMKIYHNDVETIKPIPVTDLIK